MASEDQTIAFRGEFFIHTISQKSFVVCSIGPCMKVPIMILATLKVPVQAAIDKPLCIALKDLLKYKQLLRQKATNRPPQVKNSYYGKKRQIESLQKRQIE